MTIPAPGRLTAPVSVIIPCFRCAATIGRAVESIMLQSTLPREIILIDDASGDDTLAALHRLRARLGEGFVKIIAQPVNCGAAAARNVGWDAAHAKFVAFLDADDAWHPKKLEIQLHVMLTHPGTALSGHHAEISSALPDPGPPDGVLVEKISFRQLLLANRFITPSVLIKRDLPFRFRAGQRHMEDHLLWMQIAASGATVLRLNAKLAVTFKPAYGAAGLSKNLWLMEKAECGNYTHLAKSGVISRVSALALCVYSILKFFKRIAVVATRQRVRRAPASSGAPC
jgi:teichuronic acid biosynthesis glycosyltransferase TuaG